MRYLATFLAASVALVAQDYTGPMPPKADVPYLLHASSLVETDVAQANIKEEKKNETTFQVSGDRSNAETPLPEPIFIFRSDRIRPQEIELYRFEVKGGNRELKLKNNPGKNDAHPLFLSIRQIEGNLYRIEADETLERGEYSLSPSSTNEVFTFRVY